MSYALSAGQRTSLERLISQARRILEHDLASIAAGRYGIDVDGSIAPEDDLRLDATALSNRREIVEVAQHLRSEGAAQPAAVRRLLREAVFTHLNRLVAIRIAETQGLLPQSIANGRSSQGFRDLLEAVPLLASDEVGGYWTYLQLCGDELSADMPKLFDPRNPLLALAPSPGALDELTALLSEPANSRLWTASDCLGWVYQFFNTREERSEMRASAAPSDSRELAVRNQFFTPRYVVDFLVQNSLGRRLVDAEPDSPLLAELPLLVDPPTARREAADLNEMTVLDPACGSGHFLLAAYDVLERAWHYQGVSPSDAAPAIVASLWGIDIDPRCAQVAAAAVMFRARRSCPDGDLPRPNIACARSLPATATGLEAVLSSLPQTQRSLVESLTEVLADAPVLGSLLKIEHTLTAEVKGTIIGGPALPGTFADMLPAEAVEALEDDVLADLTQLARATTASPAERLLAAEADDAIRFVQALQRRYDAVLMNPPFGEPVPTSKTYLQSNYSWIPRRTTDMLAAFVGRGVELCKPGGYVGAITNRTALFIKTFEDWRREVLLRNSFVCMADLGFGVMEGATVEAAAYVIRAESVQPRARTTFIRLLRDEDRPGALARAVHDARSGRQNSRVTRVSQSEFEVLPQAAIAYSMGPSVRQLLTRLDSLERNNVQVRVGLQTGDDFRFIRALWEVSPGRIGRSVAETCAGKPWVPFAKGGDYGPFWTDIHLVVNYGEDGRALREYEGSVIRNPQFYFQPGVTWPRRTNSALSARILPAGCIFADKGPSAFSSELLGLLSWLNSRVVRLLIDSTSAAGDETQTGGVPSRSYEVGIIQSLPAVPAFLTDPNVIAETAQLAARASYIASLDETSPRFVRPETLNSHGARLADRLDRAECDRLAAVIEVLESYDVIDARAADLVQLDPETLSALDDVVGPITTRLSNDALAQSEIDSAARLLTEPVADVVEEATAKTGMARFVRLQHQIVDRRIELGALAVRRSPHVLSEFALERRLMPTERIPAAARGLVSYFVGCAFGRWDARVGRDGSRGPSFEDLTSPVPVCAPGMLVSSDGLPVSTTPQGYLFDLPSDGLLVDEPGHAWDIEARVAVVADVLVGAGSLRSDIEVAVGSDIRTYLRRRFFRDHLLRYSKSRRKAPIYWPLYLSSGCWGVWVYAHALNRETIYAVTSAAAARLAAAESEIARLQRERAAGGAGRSALDVSRALEAEGDLANELRRFHTEAERIAGLGWEPNLDDGILLCAAPLAGIFPGWRDAATVRDEIRAGKYPWASVSGWADKL